MHLRSLITATAAATLSLAASACSPGSDAAEPERVQAAPGVEAVRYVLPAGTQASGIRIAELSGLAWDADEQLLYAVSDQGQVVHFRLRLDGDRIVGCEAVFAATLTDPQPGAVQPRKGFNAEGLAVANAANGKRGDSELIVSLEGGGRPAILRFNPAGRLVGRLAVPAPADDPANYRKKGQGLEAVAIHPVYGVMTAPESPLRAQPQDRHTIYAEGKHWSFTRFAPDSRLKGLELLPNGSLVVLERTRNGAKDSLIASLRRVDLGSCPDGGPCATETLAVLPAGPDNFEGLALLDAKHMLLVSDDGGSATQGTRFVLVTRP